MPADIPPLDDEPLKGNNPAEPKAAAPADAPVPPVTSTDWGSSKTGRWVALGVLGVIMLFGATQILKVLGIFDVRLLWMPTPEPLSLNSMKSATPAAAPAATPVGSRPAPDPGTIKLHDQAPHPPTNELPQFSIRDGEPYDFITDLDSETLRRLQAVQGQMERLTTLLTTQSQTLRMLSERHERDREQASAYQQQMQQALTAAHQQLAAISLTVQDLEARLKRGQRLDGGGAPPSGTPVTGWSVTAISGERAWLRTPQGKTITVTVGEHLKTLGTVQAVDPRQRIVVFNEGRYVR